MNLAKVLSTSVTSSFFCVISSSITWRWRRRMALLRCHAGVRCFATELSSATLLDLRTLRRY